MNKSIYIIRHGKLVNPRDILYGSLIEMDMSDEGREQIKKLGEKILKSGKIPQKIITSDLRRTLESSEILAKELKISEIEKTKDLRDSFVPAIAGKPMSILKKLYARGIDEYSDEFVKRGNESREQVAERMLAVFWQALEDKTEVIAMVSHGDPILFLMYKLEHHGKKIPRCDIAEKETEYLAKGNAWMLVVSNTGKLVSKTLIKPD